MPTRRWTNASRGIPLDFILAVPDRSHGEFDNLLKAFHQTHGQDAGREVHGERPDQVEA